jgi:acyl-CoA thioester hydrolase
MAQAGTGHAVGLKNSRRHRGKPGVASLGVKSESRNMSSEFTITRTVEFAETDMAGIMHFSNYFRWMEACETAFFRSLGLPSIAFRPGQVVGWPRVSVSCEYRAPVRFGDTVEVALRVEKIGTSSVIYAFRFRRAGVLTAQGRMTVVCVKSGMQGGMNSQRISAAIRAKLHGAASFHQWK